MSPKARTGLLAFLIVGGLFLSMAAVVGAVVVMGDRKAKTAPVDVAGPMVKVGTPAAPPKAEPVRPAPAPPDVESAIRLHGWWSRPIPRGRLDWFLDVILKTNAGTVLFFDRQASYETFSQAQAMWGFQVINFSRFDQAAFIVIGGPRRWDRTQAASAVLAAIDKAEFTHGPGR